MSPNSNHVSFAIVLFLKLDSFEECLSLKYYFRISLHLKNLLSHTKLRALSIDYKR